MTEQIRIILVDDNQDIHDVVKKLIEQTNDITLVGQAYDGESGVSLCQIARPDLVLMDVVMPGMNGADATAAIMAQLPATKVLVLSSFHEYEYIRTMLDSGAIGYLVKDGFAQDLVETIRSTVRGNTVFSPQAAQAILAPLQSAYTTPPDFGLTERELEVLKHMADGLPYKSIAHELRISQPTVRFHVNNLLEKLQVETRSEALVFAAKYNLC